MHWINTSTFCRKYIRLSWTILSELPKAIQWLRASESGRLSLVSWRGAVKDEPRADKGNDLDAAKCYVTTVHGRSRDEVPNYYAHENEPYSPSRQLSRGRERNTTWTQEQTPSNLFTSAFGWRARPGEILEPKRAYKRKQYYIIAREKKPVDSFFLSRYPSSPLITRISGASCTR